MMGVLTGQKKGINRSSQEEEIVMRGKVALLHPQDWFAELSPLPKTRIVDFLM